MKITKVSIWVQHFALSRPYEVTYVRHESVQNYVFQIETNSNIGLGTGSPSRHVTGEHIVGDITQLEHQLSSVLLGQDLRGFQKLISDCSTLLQGMPAVLASVDMALHDLFCKEIGVHISTFLGIKVKPLPTSITIGIKSLEETLEEGKEYVDRGFKRIKLKIGTDYDIDLERYIKLRDATPRHVDIRVDANQGFSTAQLLAYIDHTSDAPVEFFEQPLNKGDFGLMKPLSKKVRDQCAGDEDCQTMSDALLLAEEPLPYGIFNIKLMKCGGIMEARRISDVAYNKGIDLMWGCMDESCISISAALNIAYACPMTEYIDLDGSFDLASDIASGGFILKEGIMYPDMSDNGLSVQLLK